MLSETQKRINAVEYSSVMCSLFLAVELEPDVSKHDGLIRYCAKHCSERVTSDDVKAILQRFMISTTPSVLLYYEEMRITKEGMGLVDFFRLGNSMRYAGMM